MRPPNCRHMHMSDPKTVVGMRHDPSPRESKAKKNEFIGVVRGCGTQRYLMIFIIIRLRGRQKICPGAVY